MKEELDSQLSAMFDDELPEAECQLLARRLSRDEALKARWRRYAIIGAAIRAERGVRLDTNLAARVSAAISAEPALAVPDVAQPRKPRTGLQWWQPVAGGAIAAGVAALSLVWMRAQDPVGIEADLAQKAAPSAIAGAAPADVVAGAEEGSSYVVPTNVEPRTFVPPAALANYVLAHSEFSTPVSRRNLLSALVASESGTSGDADESDGAADRAEAVEDPSENVDQAH